MMAARRASPPFHSIPTPVTRLVRWLGSSLWGLSQLIIGLIYLLAAIRYRSLIPLLYVLFTLEYAVRFWVGTNKAIETAGTAPGSVINLPFMIAGVVLFALSIWRGQAKS